MFPDRRARSFLDTAGALKAGGGARCSRVGRCRGTCRGGTPARTGAPASSSPSTAATSPADDLRRLDWRAYGRSDRFFVKEFEADTNLRCCLVVDTSGSMDYGSAGTTKIEYARKIAAALGHLALSQGDAVGLSLVADGLVKNIPPRRNPAHLSGIFDALEAARPKGKTQLAPILHELAETTRQRALMVILSDFFVEPEVLRGCFQHLRFRKHDVAAFHLLDPQEVGLDLAPLTVALIATSVISTAFVGEIIRSGLEAVRPAQIEAAMVMNFGPWQRLRLVALPQAWPLILPPVFGYFVLFIKDTALASQIGVLELTDAGKILNTKGFSSFLVYGTVLILYFVVSYPLALVGSHLEGRLGASRHPRPRGALR